MAKSDGVEGDYKKVLNLSKNKNIEKMAMFKNSNFTKTRVI